MVNYELLRTFVVAARSRTFGAAAAERRVSVSAIAQQVKALEAQLGVALFERIGRRVQLTPAGQSLAAAREVALARWRGRGRAAHVRRRVRPDAPTPPSPAAGNNC